MNLARSAVRGLGATLAGQWGTLLISTASTMALARLLTPRDYGLVGMVLAITGLANRLKTMGLSTATVQRRSIDQGQLSVLFWINAGLGVVMALLMIAIAPLIARFYGEPELTPIVMVLSTTFIFSGFGAQHVALLNRRMRFGALATIDVTVMTIAAGIAIVAAWLGAGFWALVLFHVVQPVLRGGLAWLRTRWSPSRPGRASGMKEILAFGANLSAYETLVYISRNGDNVIIGRFLGAAELGIYSKAYQLLLLPVQQLQGPIQRVAVPTLSKLQDDPVRFRNYFCTGVAGAATLAMPLLLFLALAANEVVLILLGDQWTEAVPIFRILAFAGLGTAISHSNSWLYIALGRTRQQMLWGIRAHPFILLSFFAGLPWGVRGVATAFALAVWLLLLPSFWFATRGTPVRVGDILSSAVRPAVLAGVAFATTWAVALTVGDLPVLLSLAVKGLAYVLSFAAALAVWPAARRQAAGLMRLVRDGFSTPSPVVMDPDAGPPETGGL
jgi:O-antigen/teichoic acid export membrane protein